MRLPRPTVLALLPAKGPNSEIVLSAVPLWAMSLAAMISAAIMGLSSLVAWMKHMQSVSLGA